MNELVGELQKEISELLQPASQRCDRFAKEQAKEYKKSVEVWHEWIQELFCDAVGFHMGGLHLFKPSLDIYKCLDETIFMFLKID